MDGFDLGTAILLPFVGRNDIERRVVINTVGPVWEGNQVWLILGGGAIFAAWPRALCRQLLRLLSRHVPGAAGADPAAGGLQVPQQAGEPRLAHDAGTGRCSSAASCRRWCSASPSAICSSACRSASTAICACTSTSRCSRCSIRSRCWPGWCRVAMLMLHGATWLSLKADGAPGQAGARGRALCGGWRSPFCSPSAGVWASQLDGYRITSALAPTAPPIR